MESTGSFNEKEEFNSLSKPIAGPLKQDAQDKNVAGEQEGTGTLWALLKPIRPSNQSLGILVLLTLLATVFELALPLYSKHLVDQLSIQAVDQWVIIGMFVLVLVMAALEWATAYYGGRMGHQINFRLRFRLIGRLLDAQQSRLDTEHSAELSARIMNDSKEVKTILSEDLIGLIGGLVSIIAVIAVLFILDWRLSLIIIACIGMGALIITPIALQMHGISLRLQTAEADLVSQSTEWFRHSKMIKAFSGANQIRAQAKGLLEESYGAGLKETRNLAVIGPVANLVLMLSLISLLASSAYFIADGSLTLGTLTAFILYLFGLTFPLISLGMFFGNLNKAAGASVRLKEIDNVPQEEADALSNSRLSEEEPSDQQEIYNQPINQIHFEGVSFARDGKEILKDVNLSIEQPGVYFITGESGSGKSTLLQQLLGFYDLNGNITLNETDAKGINTAFMRQKIAWLDQEATMFVGTLQENLLFGQTRDISEQRIVNEIEKVGLKPWFNKLTDGLDTQMNEQSLPMSGGERQRLAFVRILLRDFDVLLLDEPTSALDVASESVIMNLVKELAETKIVLMVTHRTSKLDSTSMVIEMDAGKITSFRNRSQS